MRSIDSTITAKGQVTIPIEVRRHLGVNQGDKITFIVDDDGEVRVKPAQYPTIASLRGVAGTLKKPMSWEEMRDIAREDYLQAKYSRHDG